MTKPMKLLFCSHLDDPNEWIPELKRHMSDLEIEVWPEVKDRAGIDAILVWLPPAEGGLAQFPNLKAIQSLGAGVNQLDLKSLPRHIPLARLVDPGLNISMRDYCVWAVLRHYRGLDMHAEDTTLRLEFPERVKNGNELRKMLVRLAGEARAKA